MPWPRVGPGTAYSALQRVQACEQLPRAYARAVIAGGRVRVNGAGARGDFRDGHHDIPPHSFFSNIRRRCLWSLFPSHQGHLPLPRQLLDTALDPV